MSLSPSNSNSSARSNSPGVQARRDLLGLALGERQLDLGVLGTKERDGKRHQRRARGRERRHAQLATAQAGDRLHVRLRCGYPPEDPLGVSEQGFAGRRQADAARQALDERDAGLSLECRDLLRDGGLGVGELLGGSGDRALPGNLDENLETAELKH